MQALDVTSWHNGHRPPRIVAHAHAIATVLPPTPRSLVSAQARELKTVYVPQATEGLYLRLVLHKCHVNEYNLYNQVRPSGRSSNSITRA